MLVRDFCFLVIWVAGPEQKKKVSGRLWATFEGGFFMFSEEKQIYRFWIHIVFNITYVELFEVGPFYSSMLPYFGIGWKLNPKICQFPKTYKIHFVLLTRLFKCNWGGFPIICHQNIVLLLSITLRPKNVVKFSMKLYSYFYVLS